MVWIRIRGFPMNLWTWIEFANIVGPFGAVVLELDPGTRSRYDWRFARIRIGISDITGLPHERSLNRRNANDFVSTRDLTFDVETEHTENVHAWRGRSDDRPYPNGTAFGVRPKIPNPASPLTNPNSNPTLIDPPLPDNMEEDIPNPPPASQHPSTTLPPPVIPVPHPPAIPVPHPHQNTRSADPVTHRHALHGPSPQPPRQRGVVLQKPSPVTRPVLAVSPPEGKGKKALPNCGQENDPYKDGYETSDSDENSFQQKLNASYNSLRGPGSTSPSHL